MNKPFDLLQADPHAYDRREDELAADLARAYDIDNLPTDVKERVYSLAYEAGHYNGLSEVANCYGDLAGLALLAYTAGFSRS
jgi:hypothetical protein